MDRKTVAAELVKVARRLVAVFDEDQLLEDISRAMRSVPGVREADVGASSNVLVTMEDGRSFSIGTDEENLDFGSRPKFWVIDMDTHRQKAVRIDLTEDRDVARQMTEFIFRSFR